MLTTIGRWSFAHPKATLAAWITAFVVVLGLAGAIGPSFNATFEVPESETSRGFETLDTYFDGLGAGAPGSIVFKAEQGVDDPAVQAAMDDLFAEVTEFEGVTVVSPYGPSGQAQVNPDRTIAFAQLSLAETITQSEAAEIGAEIGELIPEIEGTQIEVGGAMLAEFHPPESELIGLSFAVVILIVSFGSVMAMGLPIGTAVFGVGIGVGLINLLSRVIDMPDFAIQLGAMIGLGVGIDYALFIVTRYRESMHAGNDPKPAAAEAIDTAGRAVLFAGITVVISLLGMMLMGLAFVTGLGVGASVTVLITMIASVTLLPAFLGFAGEKIERTRAGQLVAAGLLSLTLLLGGLGLAPAQVILGSLAAAVVVFTLSFFVPPLNRYLPERQPKPLRDSVWYRWSRLIQARPWFFAIGGTALLLAMAYPVLDLNLGFSDEGNYPEETTTRQAYDLLSEGFGPGFNGPFMAAVELDNPSQMAQVAGLVEAINADPGVQTAVGPFPNDPNNPEAAIIQIIPTTSPQDPATETLVQRLRTDVVPAALQAVAQAAGQAGELDVNITGGVPANIDFTDYLSRRIVIFFSAVLGLSFMLLMMVFRSVLVPLKAVIMNVLSIAAAYGVVVAIFQWGWGADVLGIEPAPIEPFIPMMLFAIVFGLSMDYEVFLLSRIKEEFDRTGDAVNSVADGLAATARVISAAAAIMVVVFGAFLLEDFRVIKIFGTGLAVAVLLDATLVRMLLVPATMELLGARNWWLPSWLDRLLPQINVEGSRHHDDPAAAGSLLQDAAAGNGGDPASNGGGRSSNGAPDHDDHTHTIGDRERAVGADG